MRLIPYARQSRSDEVSVEIERQIADMQKWATKHGHVLLDPVSERSTSGNTSWRERELGSVVSRLEAGEAEGIIVPYFSRLTREKLSESMAVLEALQPFARVNATTGRVVEPGSEIDLYDVIEAHQARTEWTTLAGNLRNGKHEAFEKGVFVGKAPTGFESPRGEGAAGSQWSQRQQRWLAGPLRKNGHSETIGRAYRLRERGGSWTDVAELLTAEGVPNARGGIWSDSAARALIRNPLYRGVWRCKCGCGAEEFRADLVVVSEKTWTAAQPEPGLTGATGRGGAGRGQGRKDRGKALLGGLLRCACCNRTLVRSENGRGNVTYRCNSNRVQCAAKAAIMLHIADRHVSDLMFGIFEGFERPDVHTPSLAILDAEIEQARKRLDLWDEAMGDDDDVAAWKRQRKVRVEALNRAKARRAEANVAVSPEQEALYAALESNDPRAISTYWHSLPVQERRALIAKQFPQGFVVVKGKGDVSDRLFTRMQYQRRARIAS